MAHIDLNPSHGIGIATPHMDIEEKEMEDINPLWKVLNRIRYNLNAGNSVRHSVLDACNDLQSALEKKLFKWVQQYPCEIPSLTPMSFYRQQLFFILNDGLQGKPIYEALQQLEEDVLEQIHLEIDEHVAKLPFLSLIPMLLFIGPAFFLLLIGPLILSMLKELTP